MIRAAASVVFLMMGTLYAQPAPARRFEVAAIKSSRATVARVRQDQGLPPSSLLADYSALAACTAAFSSRSADLKSCSAFLPCPAMS